MSSRPVRIRGMEAPYAMDQISALVLHPIISAAFVVLCALSMRRSALAVALVPFAVLNVVLVALWSYLSWVDPAGEGGCRLRTVGADTPHYCNYCRKSVQGFDHHCSWLNTCISARNYGHFYFLTVCGSLLYLFMVAIGIQVLILSTKREQRDAFGTLTGARVAWGVFLALAGWVAVSFVALAGFHSYLLLMGMGTYDWVVLQNQKRRERLASRRRSQSQGSRVSGGSLGSNGSSVSARGNTGEAAPAKRGRWGGITMGVGVTPPRSKVTSGASQSKGSNPRDSAEGAVQRDRKDNGSVPASDITL